MGPTNLPHWALGYDQSSALPWYIMPFGARIVICGA